MIIKTARQVLDRASSWIFMQCYSLT